MRSKYYFSIHCFDLGEECLNRATELVFTGDLAQVKRLRKRSEMLFAIANLFGFEYEDQHEEREDRYFRKAFPEDYLNV